MKRLVAWLRARLAGREDSEHGQAVVRFGALGVVLVYLLAAPAEHRSPAAQDVMAMVIAGFVIGTGILVWLVAAPGRSHVRRMVGIASDFGLMAAAMIRMGEPIAWVYVLLLWATVGNGLRYGTGYLAGAVVAALAVFGLVISRTPYWQDNLALGVGLWVGLCAIPMYLTGLLSALTRATGEARRANEAKSRFLANMSHEFRTPLNGLAGMTEVLASTRLDSEQRECVSTIQASTRTLMALVEDVLDISAIEAGKLRLHAAEFEPREVIVSVGLILEPMAREKGLEYRTRVAPGVPRVLRGDMAHLRQVLINLVGNAVKFTDAGHVMLDVEALRVGPDSSTLRFTVTDTGIGIPETVRTRLFDAFEQADVGLSRRHAGTGLGTTIAKGLAEAMGGTIGFESTEGKGSRFWVEIPFGTAQSPAAAAPEHGRSPTGDDPPTFGPNVIAFSNPFLRHRARVRSLSVLVADDHAANRMVLQRLLQKSGHRATCVEGGEAVLDALAESNYDLVIADLHMPGMSGVEMLRQLRLMEAGGPGTPVVILSADVTPAAIESCREAGAWGFLPKPVSTARLLDTLADVAEKQPAAAAPLDAPTSLDPSAFDPSVLDELGALGLGATFEREFCSQCMSDAERCLRAAAEAAACGDWNEVREHAHALKGVAGNVGLALLSAEAGELMRVSDARMPAESALRINGLRQRLGEGRTLLAVRRHIAPGEDGSAETRD